MTANHSVECQVDEPCVVTGAITRCITDTNRIAIDLQREIEGITSNEQECLQQEFTIGVISYDSWWQSIGVYHHQNTIEHHVNWIGLSDIHLMTHKSESIWPMGSLDKIITETCEWLHISNVNEELQFTIQVSHIQQMPKHNDLCTSLD